MLADDPRIGRRCSRIDLVVHQQSELSPVTLERAQAVGNSDHAVTTDVVPYGQNRNEFDSRHARHQVRLGVRARGDVGCRCQFPGQQKRWRADQQRGSSQRGFQETPTP